MNKTRRVGRRPDKTIWDWDNNKKRCTKCKEWKPFSSFKPKERWYSWCKECRSMNAKKHSNPRQKKYYANKLTLMKMKGDKCEECGFEGDPKVFDFHHLHPEKKTRSLSQVYEITEAVLAELNECALLCSNCHRIKH